MVVAVRGAITVEHDSKEFVISRVNEMVDKIYKDNSLDEYSVVSILFSITDDLTSINPAAALRAGGGYKNVPLFCSQEPKSDNSLKQAIRVIITWNGDGPNTKPCYLHGAKILRPDLIT